MNVVEPFDEQHDVDQVAQLGRPPTRLVVQHVERGPAGAAVHTAGPELELGPGLPSE